MSDLHTNGTANRAPTVVQDDIVERLEWHNTCVRNADDLCLLQQALYKIEHQQSEIERLRRWKAEAIEVLRRWDAVADMVPVRLGDRKSDAVAAEIERLHAERALADKLARALRSVIHDKPTAHTDEVWLRIHKALEAHEEARRG